jgi:HrpA-like RNA helicase
MTDETEIEYMTDGLALRYILSDPLMSQYSCVILDEAHERTISTDILMAVLKEVCLARPDFRLIIASATLAAQKFSEYFHDCPILNVPGKLFEINKLYCSQPEANYLSAAATTVFQIHLSNKGAGDILVFLTGEQEVSKYTTFTRCEHY